MHRIHKVYTVFLLLLASVLLESCANSYIVGENPQLSMEESGAGLQEFAEDSEHIAYDPGTGTTYVNNELIVYMATAATEADVEKLSLRYNAEADCSMADIGIYRLVFDEPMGYAELEALAAEMSTDPAVESADLNLVTEIGPDSP